MNYSELTPMYKNGQTFTHSFVEIGNHLGVSQQRAAFLHKKLIVKLRQKFCEDKYIREWLIENGFPMVESTQVICEETA